jgi:nucleotide-binding universal stress UspA family protein
MRILVGTDGSIGGQAALRWAVGFASAIGGGEVVVGSAWQPTFAEFSNEEFEVLRTEAADRLEEWCEPARAAKVAFRSLLLDGDPREQLLAAAEAEEVDLVVVGARGMGGHAHALHLGSVTHHLVHHTTRPLAAIPPPARLASPAPVVVGVDGSQGSFRALAWCGKIAAGMATEVIAVHAEEPLAEWVPHADPHSWYQVAREHVEEWVAPLRRAGITVRVLVAEGSPVDALTDAAIREQAGLVVVGSRGLGGITGLRLGSTALKVLHHGHLPVVMVPAATG